MANNYGVLSGVVGPAVAVDGANANLRMDKTGAACVTDTHGHFQEAVLRGNVYSAQTAATGVAPGTAIGTTGAFTLHNPVASGKKLVILRASMGYISGTLGAGTIHYLANPSTAAVPTGTAITPINVGTFANTGSAALAFTTSTITSPLAIGTFANLGASLASTAVQPWQVVDYPDGLIVVSAGCSLTLHATAAGGSTPLVVFNMVWEEIAA